MAITKITRGIAICHFNRLEYLAEIIQAVQATAPPDARLVVCDDGSTFIDNYTVEVICKDKGVLLIKGPNLGVAANKNRALWALQDCHYICILEDDLKPVKKNWFESYESAAQLSGIHYFVRVQDKQVSETIESFSAFMAQKHLHPIYGLSPRGDLTFLTSNVIRTVGAFNPLFRGAGYAHGEHAARVARAGLINHPLRWIDIKEARDSFVQVGDTEGGRWNVDSKEIKRQLQRNKQVLKELERTEYTYHPLVLE